MNEEITPAEWEKYLAELNDLEEKYLADRDAIRDKFTVKQQTKKASKGKGERRWHYTELLRRK